MYVRKLSLRVICSDIIVPFLLSTLLIHNKYFLESSRHFVSNVIDILYISTLLIKLALRVMRRANQT